MTNIIVVENQPKSFVKITIKVQKSSQPDSEKAYSLLKQLYAIENVCQLQIEVTNKKIQWSISALAEDGPIIKSIVHSSYPSAYVSIEPNYRLGNDSDLYIYNLHLNFPFPFPISMIQDGGSSRLDTLSGVLTAFATLDDDEEIIYEISLLRPRAGFVNAGKLFLTKSNLSADKYSKVGTALAAEYRLAKGDGRVGRFEGAMQTMLEKKASSPLKEVVVSVKIKTPDGLEKANKLMDRILPAFSIFGKDSFNFFVPPNDNSHQPMLTAAEAATLWHLPSQNLEIPTIDWVPNKVPLPPKLVDELTRPHIVLGTGEYQGESNNVPLTYQDRINHVNIIGASGMGKSTLMHNAIHKDIANGKGVGLIDPHGDLVQDVLTNSIPKERIKDVILFSLRDKEFPIGLNLLSVPDGVDSNTVVNQTLDVVKLIFEDSWSATRMEDVLYATLSTLQYLKGATIRDIPRLLLNAEFRAYAIKQLRENSDDQDAIDFWLDEYEGMSLSQQQQVAQPINNRIRKFYRDKTIKHIICQESSLDFRNIIDSGKIFLADLGSEENIDDRVLGALLISKLQMAAMSRALVPKDERMPFYLYVDEVQRFTATSLPRVFSEARKYGLALTIGNQHLSQLEGKTLDSVKSNVGTTIIFRTKSDKDARVLNSLIKPGFTPTDLVDLDRGQTVVKTQLLGEAMPPFSMTTFFPPKRTDDDDDLEQQIIEWSRQTYAKPKQQVIDELNNRHDYQQLNLFEEDGEGHNGEDYFG